MRASLTAVCAGLGLSDEPPASVVEVVGAVDVPLVDEPLLLGNRTAGSCGAGGSADRAAVTTVTGW